MGVKKTSNADKIKDKLYDETYHASSINGSSSAAQVVVPWLMDTIKPKSVIDFGCGLGAWLQCFKKHGVNSVRGIDGGHINKKELLIPKNEYIEMDFCNIQQKKIGKYDLAMSLETAEHLPSKCADEFVSAMANSANVIFFSAAIPRQGGIYHLNEQWPDYWSTKFSKHGFVAIDIRFMFLSNNRIPWWYRENMLLYVKGKNLYGLEDYIYNPDFVLIHKDVLIRYTSVKKYIIHKAHKFAQHRGLLNIK
jgi:hypothetical protein